MIDKLSLLLAVSAAVMVGLVNGVIAAAFLIIGWLAFRGAARWLLPGFGLVFGAAIIVLAQQPALWLVMVALAALPLQQSAPRQHKWLYSVLIAACVLVGGLNAADPQALIMALGLTLISHSYLHQSDAPQPHAAANQHNPTPATLPMLSADELVQLSTRIHVTADGLVRASQAIDEVATQQSNGAAEQVDVIKLTNNLLENFLHLSERVSDQAWSITRTTEETSSVSKSGLTAIKEAIEGMEQIRQQVLEISRTTIKLAQLTQRIDQIITSVSEIATQSNLLALNASIEAARAGKQGRGFAVVADEVRSLSQQSTTAARQVRGILAEIREAVLQTVKATEAGIQGVESGLVKTQEADRVMGQLARTVDSSNEAVHSIYKVIRQQGDGLEEISISMDRIDRITQQNLASTRMVKTVTLNLNRLADELQDAVEVGQQAAVTVPVVRLEQPELNQQNNH